MRTRVLTAAAVLVCSATPAGATDTPGPARRCSLDEQPGAELTLVRERVLELIRVRTFMALPRAHREAIAAEAAYRKVAGVVDRETFDGLSPVHRRMLGSIVERVGEGVVPLLPCFAPGTDEKLIGAFQAAIEAGIDRNGDRFQQTTRWGATALDFIGPFGQGEPTTLTYSFVPDGTFVPNMIGATGNSDLQAWLNGIYGSQAAWQPLFDQVFAEWGALSGVTYVYEPNDDGADLNTNPGIAGVRGDLRIAGIGIDGDGGVLAYNGFPQDGDMVLDTTDSFFDDTSNNSLALRNTASHEHGHGFGAMHVCPLTETKLMEPVIALAFDGPQLDDILNVQRHYGDANEPNDSAAQATPLGTLGNGTTGVDTVSSDDDADEDWYSFTVNAAKRITVTMTPTGAVYDSSVQDSHVCSTEPAYCCSGNFIDTSTLNDLGVEIVDTNGFSTLVSADANGVGVADSAQVTVPGAGTYYARVFSGPSDSVQEYALDVTISDAGFVPPSFSFPGGLPTLVDPRVATDIDVTINPGDDTITPGSAAFFYRLGAGAFVQGTMTDLGGGGYLATLPGAACDDAPQFYFRGTGATTGAFSNPALGDAQPYAATVGSFADTFVDDAETDIGWLVAGTATDGLWDRGVPENNDRGDPPADADGSGQAWLTDNDLTTVNSDVDNGYTTLTSPVFDLSNGGTVSWQFWFNDAAGGELDGDSFRVFVSTNGGSSYELRRFYSTAQPAWRSDSIEVGVEVPATSAFRIRFLVDDLGVQNIVEGGLDDLRINELICTDPNPPCSEADVTTAGAGAGDPDYGLPDGQITAADLNYFVNAWVASDPAVADITTAGAGIGDPNYGIPDGQITAADLNYFVNIWLVGCP